MIVWLDRTDHPGTANGRIGILHFFRYIIVFFEFRTPEIKVFPFGELFWKRGSIDTEINELIGTFDPYLGKFFRCVFLGTYTLVLLQPVRDFFDVDRNSKPSVFVQDPHIRQNTFLPDSAKDCRRISCGFFRIGEKFLRLKVKLFIQIRPAPWSRWSQMVFFFQHAFLKIIQIMGHGRRGFSVIKVHEFPNELFFIKCRIRQHFCRHIQLQIFKGFQRRKSDFGLGIEEFQLESSIETDIVRHCRNICCRGSI